MDITRYFITDHRFLNHLNEAQQIANNPQGDHVRGLLLLNQVARNSVTWAAGGYNASIGMPRHHVLFLRIARHRLEAENFAKVQTLRAIFHLREARVLMARLKESPTHENIRKAREKLLTLHRTPDAFSNDQVEVEAFKQLVNYSVYGATVALVEGLRNDEQQTDRQRESRQALIRGYLRHMGLKPRDLGLKPHELKAASAT